MNRQKVRWINYSCGIRYPPLDVKVKMSKSKFYSETVNNYNSQKKKHVRQIIHCIYIQMESKAYKYIQRYVLGKNLHTRVSQKLI